MRQSKLAVVPSEPLSWLLRDKRTGELQTPAPYKASRFQQDAKALSETLQEFCQAYITAYPAETYQHRSCAWLSNLFTSAPFHTHGRSDEVAALQQAAKAIDNKSLINDLALHRLQLLMYAYVRHRVQWYRNKQAWHHNSLGVVFNFVETLLAMSLHMTMRSKSNTQIWLNRGQEEMKNIARGRGLYRQIGGVDYEAAYTNRLDQWAEFASAQVRNRWLRQVSSTSGLKESLLCIVERGRLLPEAQVQCELIELASAPR